MCKKFNKEYATIYTDERGQHMVMLPGGVHMPHLTETIVVSRTYNEPAEVTMKFLCNITQTKEQALEKYNQKE